VSARQAPRPDRLDRTRVARPARSARGVALAALLAVDGGARANEVVPALLAESGLAARDRAFVTELVYGTCRMQRACDWLVGRHLRTRAEPAVLAAMRLGVYQLVWLRTPAHAAVAATVAEVASPGRSVVNAVLRRVAADLEAGPPRWPDPATQLSYPDWIVERLARDLGPGAARAALETMNHAALVHQRTDGYIQDPASEMVAKFVASGLDPDDRVADVCAAPGGKATAIAGMAGLVVASDPNPQRAVVVAANVRRLGLGNVITVVADGTRPPLRPASFARVLVDAPCSGLGVLRRRPDARWRVTSGDVERLAALQRRLLVRAAELVRPGGVLVYSVCTLLRDETTEIDRFSAGRLAGWAAVEPPGAPWTPLGRGALLLPQAEGTDGMYVLALAAPPSESGRL
jgi:16S rRNA (cytosine967-C5)-methyltransferase